MTTSPRASRIESIDILRGFTLFGIALVHMVEQYYAGQWPEQVTNPANFSIADNIAAGFTGIFISGKFYMIFSFLFGLSFFIQFSKSDSEKNFLLRFSWRLLILFAIGFIHSLHYRGDILTIYAGLGFGLILFRRLPDKYLLWAAALLILNVPSFLMRGAQAFLSSGDNPFRQDEQVLMTYYNTLKSGSYVEILKVNLPELKGKMMFQVFSGRLFITFGLFLLGIYAGRKRFFENIQDKKALLKKMMRYALFFILGAVVFATIVFGGLYLIHIQVPDMIGWMVGGLAMDVFNTALAVIYVAGILMLLQKEKWQQRLQVLYPVGRMGLTTYLMQTLVGTLIFFSYGLALLGDIGALASMGLGIAWFVVQIIFARYWFRYFSFGPVEWLWRNLTYLKIQPMMIQRSAVSN